MTDSLAHHRDGGDVVDLLVGRHQTIRALSGEVAESAGARRRTAFERLVRLLAVHETAAEQLVPPLVKVHGHGSAEVVDQRLAEAVAPTHPHPGVESAAANYVAGPVLSLFVRTKDLVRTALTDRGRA